MDRLAAFSYWRDRQCWAQALLVARFHPVGWPQLQAWAELEGLAPPAWARFHLIPGIVRLNGGARPEPTTLLLQAARVNA